MTCSPGGAPLPTDGRAPRFPVSIKGVLLLDRRAVLLRNERHEWELPGGKLELGEDPMSCLAREIREELGFQVTVGRILDCWVYDVVQQVEVVIVTYHCTCPPDTSGDDLRISAEHADLGLFSPDKLAELRMPDGYRRSILRAID